MLDARRESKMIMALEEIESGSTKSVHSAAVAFEDPYTTYYFARPNKQMSVLNNAMIFSLSEEDYIFKYILDLDSKGYPVKYEDIAQMAQSILDLTRTYGSYEARNQITLPFSKATPRNQGKSIKGNGL